MISQNSTNFASGGNIVLRGNQLVWLPSGAAGQGTTPSAHKPAGTSPVKIHVIGGNAASKNSAASSSGQTRTHTLPLTIKVNSTVAAKSNSPAVASNDHNALIVHRQPSPTGAGGPSTVLFKGHSDKGASGSNVESKTGIVSATKSPRQAYKILFPAAQRENRNDVSNFKQATPTSGAIMKPIKSEFANLDGKKSLVYYADASTEDDVHGMTIGANSLQNLTAQSVPSFKKQGLYLKGGLRKPCNCTKSMCLKLYCDCFANGEFCKNCNCTCCKNNLSNENDRSKAIKSCLERNPMAFQPKIGKGRADADRLHNKGCNCKKSSCLKNYCECYEAKVACTPKCKCVTCRNTDNDRTHRVRSSGLMSLATAAASAAPIGAQISEYPLRSISPMTDVGSDKQDPKKMPWYYMNDDVLQATTLCLVAQAEQMENRGVSDDVDLQRAVLREFGRCLHQIIQSASY